MVGCSGVCLKYKAIHKEFVHSRYADGQKRFSRCDIFLTWDVDNKCPCCGRKLRVRPKNSRLKKQYDDIINQKQQFLFYGYPILK